MSLYVVTSKATGDEVIRYVSMTPLEMKWPFSEYDHTETDPDEPVVVPGTTRLTRLQFVGRMGEAAMVAILAMAQQSVEIAAWVKLLDWATPDPDGTSIDLADPRTIAGLQALEPLLIAQGVVTEGWAQGVLNGQ